MQGDESMANIRGDINQIDLSTSLFRNIIENGNLYIDKTRFIESFLRESNSVQLVVRQRRLGKSLNMDTLYTFLTDLNDNRALFNGLYIESSQTWHKAHSAPTFLFDFKNLTADGYKKQINKQVDKYISLYANEYSLTDYLRRSIDQFIENVDSYSEGILLLTELVYHITGKRSYILIDEYDKLLTDNVDTENYDDIRRFETAFLSAALKGNPYLQKALLTGVMRISRESILSGLNNLAVYDLFGDRVYTDDFGLTDDEIDLLNKKLSFDKYELRRWYNGVTINNKPIYNIYSVLSFIQNSSYENYWGRSGTIKIIYRMLNEKRKANIIRLLNGEAIEVFVSRRISLDELNKDVDDSMFYSLLLQSGYLSLEQSCGNETYTLKIPNIELMNVWKEFILTDVVKDSGAMKGLFDNINNLQVFDMDAQRYLSDRLSYFDLIEDETSTKERLYHIFMLGVLSAYEDATYKKQPLSNRESGDGRYDILYERKDFSIIFEFKASKSETLLEEAADKGLKQIDERRYFTDAPREKPLIKTAIAFFGKRCTVKSKLHSWK